MIEKMKAKEMTLRDYFAAMAIQGIIASCVDQYGRTKFDYPSAAESAYEMAEEMMKKRKE